MKAAQVLEHSIFVDFSEMLTIHRQGPRSDPLKVAEGSGTTRKVFTPKCVHPSEQQRQREEKGGPTEYFSIPQKKFVPVPKLQVSLLEKLATNVDLYQ